MFSFKNFKIVKEIKNIKPRLKWLLFSQMQDYKMHSNYMDLINPQNNYTATEADAKLQAIVQDALKKEFSPEIKKMKSYNLLVDAVVHNLKKKQVKYAVNRHKN